TAQLLKSHLLPKALYRLARTADPTKPNPVFVTPKAAQITSNQLANHLLCRDCEERFNRGGETWVMANRWHSETNFPIHAALATSAPLSWLRAAPRFTPPARSLASIPTSSPTFEEVSSG